MLISNNINKLSNDQLFIQYQEIRQQLLNAEIGTPEEMELDLIFTALSKEIANRDMDLKEYKLQSTEQTKQNIVNDKKEGNKMKSLKTLISTIILTGAITISTITTAFADSKITNTHLNYKNDLVTEYSDEIATVINTNTNTYELYIPELGDYDVKCSSQQELNNLITEYKSHINDPSDLVNTIKKVEVMNTYIKYDGSIVREYNNNSWSLINYNTNTFIFTPAELTDFEINCKSDIELKNLIETYQSCKEFGYF